MIRARVRNCSGVAAVRLGALGLAAVLVLGGCSGADRDPGAEAAEGTLSSASPNVTDSADASESPSPTVTPTPTASATAKYKPASAEGPAENVPLPLMPELAKEESKEGLEAFAQYWYALVNYGYETGDAAPLKAISGTSCNICANYYPQLDQAFSGEDWMSGGQVEIRSVHSDFVLTPEGRYQVLVQLTQDSMQFFSPNQHLGSRKIDPENLAVQMIEATHGEGGWVAHDVVKIQ